MRFGSCAKFRNFVLTHPPLVVFMFCIGMTAVAFISFAYYIKANKILDPSISKDWNTLLHNATKINFCSSEVYHSDSLDNTSILEDRSDYTNVSVKLKILLSFPYSNLNQSVTSSASTINGSLLGYSEVFESKFVHLSFTFQQPLNLLCSSERGCSNVVDSCMSISAPRNMLPATTLPEHCSFTNDTSPALEMFGHLSDEDSSIKCNNVSMIINHHKDERLLMYLSETTKSRVHVHLIHSSYFLLVIVLLVLTFGFFRGGDIHHDAQKRKDNRILISSSSAF